MEIIKDIAITALIGAGFGETLMLISQGLHRPIPEHPEQKAVFLIGTILFSLVFRLFWTRRSEGEIS